MHPPELRALVARLTAAGGSDSAVARVAGVPRSTVRDWRRGARESRGTASCPRCWRPVRRPIRLTRSDYSELLGLYLGDGHIVRSGRTQRLRLSLDSRYPGVVGEARDLLARGFPANRVGTVTADGGATLVLSLYCSHLACLFPQHGPGKKHERPITLEPWQRDCVEDAPWAFLRGCIRSDGCVFVNRTGDYEYVTYDFCNHSDDIRALFCDVCRLLGLDHRHNPPRVRVNRRASVARMLDEIGRKT